MKGNLPFILCWYTNLENYLEELKNQKLTSNWTAEGDKDTKSKQTKETSQEEIAYLPEMYDFRAKP